MAGRLSPAAGAISSSSADFGDEVLVEATGHTRTAILNRPQQLNALSYNMMLQLKDLYEQWEKDSEVQLVIIKGSGRAFCAGGDVACIYRLGKSGRFDACHDFFACEYTVNYILGTFRKSHVALLDGLVLGGGAGVSIHGKFQVATEKTVFAMPETSLGLHPDVGASHFLSRLPGHLGEYVGLTGARLKGVDLLAMRLVTHFVPSERIADLENRLKALTTGDHNVVNGTINEYAENVIPKQGSVLFRLDAINKIFSRHSMEEIMDDLEKAVKDGAEDWYKSVLETLKKASPMSLKITLRSIREGRTQTLRECLQREFRMTMACCHHKFSEDFYEGCRAILIDKDRKPKWNPPTLDLVTPKMVDHYFDMLVGEEELNLSNRHGLKIVGASR